MDIRTFDKIVSERFDGLAWNEESRIICMKLIQLLKENNFEHVGNLTDERQAIYVLERKIDAYIQIVKIGKVMSGNASLQFGEAKQEKLDQQHVG